MKLLSPLLQQDTYEKQTSLDRVELADEFLQDVRNGGRRPVNRDPAAVAVIILVTVPGDGTQCQTLE
jgi:hypothetical protein